MSLYLKKTPNQGGLNSADYLIFLTQSYKKGVRYVFCCKTITKIIN